MHPGRRLAAFYPQDSHDRAKAEFCAGSSAACNAEADECRTPRHRTRLRAEGRGRKVLADPRIALALRNADFVARDGHPRELLSAGTRVLFRRRIPRNSANRVRLPSSWVCWVNAPLSTAIAFAIIARSSGGTSVKMRVIINILPVPARVASFLATCAGAGPGRLCLPARNRVFAVEQACRTSVFSSRQGLTVFSGR